ncbi:MAG: hypothetical protein P1P88_04950 [Bacteroidales bacterium]|nr:hypothetical protein [Bacteroidales bacterium]
MKIENLQKLDSMLGKKFTYEGSDITLLTYKQTGEKIELVTNGDWIHTTVFDLGIVIARMKEIHLPQVTLEEAFKQNTKFVAIKNNAIDKVQDSLLEMIDKVMSDPGNISQAESVVNIADSVVRTEKLKIEQMALLNKLQQL